MDFSIDEKPQEVPQQKPTGDSTAASTAASGGGALPPFGESLGSHFEDDLMREFDQKHSKLSSFLEDRVSDLTTGLKSQLESQSHVPTGEEQFKLSSHHDDRYDFSEYEIKRSEESKLIGDVGAGREGVDSLFKLSGSSGVVEGKSTTEPAAGDHDVGKVERGILDEHEQLMGQFERVSPNMMNFAYDDPISRSSNDDILGDFSNQSVPQHQQQEVPLSGGLVGQSAPSSFGLQSHRTTTNTFGDDYDEEDDFEKDSISQQSQPLSSKLSDSLEALKDIPKEFPQSTIVHDHFSAPTQHQQEHQVPSSLSSSASATTGTTARHFGRHEDEDNFEKDSISSHPLSSQLSDSLEVLKDSPQRDLRLDESLMDLDELPSSKNSLKSISPNEGVTNIPEEFSEIERTQHGSNLDDIGSDSISSKNLPDVSVFTSASGQYERPEVTNSEPFDSLPEVTSSFSSSSAVNTGPFGNFSEFDSSPFGTAANNAFTTSSSTPFGNMSDLTNVTGSSGPFGNLSDLTNITGSTGPFGNLPDISSSSNSNASPFSGGNNLPEVTNTNTSSPYGNLPDITNSSNVKQDSFGPITPEVEEEEDIPPPIPPHRNLGAAEVETQPKKNDYSFGDNDIDDHFGSVPTSKPQEQQQPPARASPPKPTFEEPILETFTQSHTTKVESSPPKHHGFGYDDDVEKYSSVRQTDLLAEKDDIPSATNAAASLAAATAAEGLNLMTSSMTMSTSLDNIEQPSRYYESEDSSTKTDAPLLDAELEDLNSFASLPHEQPPQTQNIVEPPPPVTISPPEKEKEVVAPKPKVVEEPVVKVVEKQEPPKPKVVKTQSKLSEQELKELREDVQRIFNTFDPSIHLHTMTSSDAGNKLNGNSNGSSSPFSDLGSGDIKELLEGPCLSTVLDPRAWFQPEKLHPTVQELVYWRDPKKSGIVFGSIFVILIAFTFLSLISVVAYTSLAVLSGTLAFRVYKSVLQTIQKTNEGHPFKEYLDVDLTVSNEKAQELSTTVVSHLNVLANKLRSLFLVEDIVESAKFGGLLYFLTYIGSWFNGLTLVILGFIALFALPKVYETNKTIIDQYIDLVMGKVSEVYAKVQAVIPFGKKEKAQ